MHQSCFDSARLWYNVCTQYKIPRMFREDYHQSLNVPTYRQFTCEGINTHNSWVQCSILPDELCMGRMRAECCRRKQLNLVEHVRERSPRHPRKQCHHQVLHRVILAVTARVSKHIDEFRLRPQPQQTLSQTARATAGKVMRNKCCPRKP